MTDTKPVEPRGARRITTAFFRDMDYIKEQVIRGGKAVRLGQIVGVIYQTIDKETPMADGSVSQSVCLVGEFEAINERTGEVVTSNICYLPTYAGVIMKANFLGGGGCSLPFMADIGAEPADKQIPWAWTCTPLQKRDPGSILNVLKRMAAEDGKLRLPPPPPLPAERIESSVAAAPSVPEGDTGDMDGHEPDPAEVAAVEQAKGRKHGKAA